MGARGTFGQAVLDMAPIRTDFFAISADLGHASGLKKFEETYPDRYVNVGIAEQDLIGIAAGLAKDGSPVIATSYAPFSSLRCADQVKNYMGYMGLNVKLVGLDSGMIQAKFGSSHYGIEDIALMRSIPNIKILSPADGVEIYQATQEAIACDGPVYIRLTGGQTLPMIYDETYTDYQIGKAVQLREGSDVTIIATGTIVNSALKVADMLEKENIKVAVIDMHTVKPLDKAILQNILRSELIVTMEEHTIYGGLGSAIAEYLIGQKVKPVQLILGVQDFYPHPGSYEYLLELCELTPDAMYKSILRKLTEIR